MTKMNKEDNRGSRGRKENKVIRNGMDYAKQKS